MFIQELVAQKKSKNEIASEVTKVCITFHVESTRICRNVTKEFQVGNVFTSRLKIMWSSWPIGRYFFQLFMRVTVRNESNTGQNIRSYEVYLFCVTQCALSTYTYGFHVEWSVDSVWPASTEPGCGLWITCWRLLRHQLQPRWKVERDVSTRSKPPVQKLKPPKVRL